MFLNPEMLTYPFIVSPIKRAKKGKQKNLVIQLDTFPKMPMFAQVQAYMPAAFRNSGFPHPNTLMSYFNCPLIVIKTYYNLDYSNKFFYCFL